MASKILKKKLSLLPAPPKAGRPHNSLPTLTSLLKEVDSPDKSSNLSILPVTAIVRNPKQPRKSFDSASLKELADTIKKVGVIQPIIVTPTEHNQYTIVAGERRWRAAQMAKIEEIPALIRAVSEKEVQVIALIENIQREELNPIEKAEGLKQLMQFGHYTQMQLSETLGMAKPTISNIMGLLKLNDKVQNQVREGLLSAGHAKALLKLKAHVQVEISDKAIKGNWSVRQIERYVSNLKRIKKAGSTRKDPDTIQLEISLAEWFAAPVSITMKNSTKGLLSITFHSLDELDGIFERIGFMQSHND